MGNVGIYVKHCDDRVGKVMSNGTIGILKYRGRLNTQHYIVVDWEKNKSLSIDRRLDHWQLLQVETVRY